MKGDIQMSEPTKSVKERLLVMLSESTIFQGVLMILVVGGWVYLLVTTGTAPADLTGAALLIIGFFFGGKFTTSMARAAQNGQNTKGK
jgi:membrane-bound ClpP family serine protease